MQILERSRTDGADHLLRHLLSEQEAHAVSETGAALRQFAGQCLDSISPSYATLRDIGIAAVEAVANVEAAKRRPAESVDTSITLSDNALIQTLLRIRAPETRDRLAIVLAEAVLRCANEMPVGSSAGLIYLWLWTTQSFNSTHVGNQIREILHQSEIPDAAARWWQLLERPSSEDVEEFGWSMLYETTVVGGVGLFESRAIRLLTEPSRSYILRDPTDPSAVRDLEELYPVLEKSMRYPGVAWSANEHVWPYIAATYSVDRLRALTPMARAVAFWILLPALSRFRDSISDERLRWFITALAGQQYRQSATDLINGLAFPSALHTYLIEAIHGLGGPGYAPWR